MSIARWSVRRALLASVPAMPRSPGTKRVRSATVASGIADSRTACRPTISSKILRTVRPLPNDSSLGIVSKYAASAARVSCSSM